MTSRLGDDQFLRVTSSPKHPGLNSGGMEGLQSAQTRRQILAGNKSPARTSLCSAASLSSDETSDSGFYQLNPTDGSTPASISPRFIPKDWRRSPNPSEMSNVGDIDFFLKMLNEFRDYVTDKIEYLEVQQNETNEQITRLQSRVKAAEEKWSHKEVEVCQEVNSIIALLHKKQSSLIATIQRKRNEETSEVRTAIETCRRNSKILNGVLAYSKRVKNETSETIRSHTVKELKQRLSLVNDLFVEEPEIPCDVTPGHMGIKDLQIIRNILEEKHEVTSTKFMQSNFLEVSPPIITAQEKHSDITKDSITIYWFDPNTVANCPSSSYEVRWSYNYKGSKLERKALDIKEKHYTITDLQPGCDVKVSMRGCYGRSNTTPFSKQAAYKTLCAPQKFCFDETTAHAKLKLSNDMKSVFYPGDDAPKGPRSPGRFSFALNILGTVSFFSGKQYWEATVNEDGWAVGIAYRSIPRNSWLGSNDSSWILHYNPAKMEYKVRHAGQAVTVEDTATKTPKSYIKKIGIYLNFDEGSLSFINADCNHIMHTCHVGTFREPVCAAANPFYHGGAISIETGLDIPPITSFR